MKPKQKMDSEWRSFQELLRKIEKAGYEELMKELEKLRQRVIIEIAQTGEIDPLRAEALKSRLQWLYKQAEISLHKNLSEWQRKFFVKGIQMVDSMLKSTGLQFALPYLSEQKLNILQDYSAEHIKGLMDYARKNIATEIDLAILGQKPISDVIKNIGTNLDSPSIFGIVKNRAETILRTEVQRINNIAINDRISQLKTQIKDMSKKWIHSHIGVPRVGHLMLDGVVIPSNETFSLKSADGTIYQVQCPHDPVLPVGEVVNCRCSIAPVVIRFETA